MKSALSALVALALASGCTVYPRVPDGERGNVTVVLCVLAYCPTPPAQKAKKVSPPPTENSHE